MYFHNGDLKETLTFHNNECTQEFVHVIHLKQDHYLFHENPYLFVNSDGIILGLDQQTPSLDLYNSNHELIRSFSFNFITKCETFSANQTLLIHDEESHHEWIILLILLLFMIVFIMISKKKGKHHET